MVLSGKLKVKNHYKFELKAVKYFAAFFVRNQTLLYYNRSILVTLQNTQTGAYSFSFNTLHFLA